MILVTSVSPDVARTGWTNDGLQRHLSLHKAGRQLRRHRIPGNETRKSLATEVKCITIYVCTGGYMYECEILHTVLS